MIAKIVFRLYKINNVYFRRRLANFIMKIEGGAEHSKTLRQIFSYYHQVHVGEYSQGAWCMPRAVDGNTRIGRYCSIAESVRILNWNHPIEYKSTHSFFFDPLLGYVQDVELEQIHLEIGNDVWMGHNAIIMPSVTSIGDGSIIGAGAVVNKNIPPFAVVVGNPARVVRYRFSKEKIDELIQEKWWEKDIDELLPHLAEFTAQIDTTIS